MAELKEAKRVDSHYSNNTWLQGYAYISYQKLVKLFGEPKCLDNYKTDAEWVVKFGNEIFTIYNWKNGKNYMKNEGIEVRNIEKWHIGGRTSANEFIEFLKK